MCSDLVRLGCLSSLSLAHRFRSVRYKFCLLDCLDFLDCDFFGTASYYGRQGVSFMCFGFVLSYSFVS